MLYSALLLGKKYIFPNIKIPKKFEFYSSSKAQEAQQYNVVGTKLQPCSMEPLTGWFRDGYCTYDKYDVGVHVVCGTMTKEVRKNIVKNSSFSNPMFFFSVFGIH